MRCHPVQAVLDTSVPEVLTSQTCLNEAKLSLISTSGNGVHSVGLTQD